MKPTVVVLALVSSACSANPKPVPVTAADACAVPEIGSAQDPWRQVRAWGFTFCVPGRWRPRGSGGGGVDANRWYGDHGSITWGLGHPPYVPDDWAAEEWKWGDDARLWRCAPPSRYEEEIDGRLVRLADVMCRGINLTFAVWSEPAAVYFAGTAKDEATRQLQLAVYRTVRFSRGPS